MKANRGNAESRLEERAETGQNEPLAALPFLLTADEAADLLRTSRKAIYAMVDRGQLPGVARVGRRLLFRAEVLLRWLSESRAPSPREGW
jgi:excisionase family DNA binding protein